MRPNLLPLADGGKSSAVLPICAHRPRPSRFGPSLLCSALYFVQLNKTGCQSSGLGIYRASPPPLMDCCPLLGIIAGLHADTCRHECKISK